MLIGRSNQGIQNLGEILRTPICVEPKCSKVRMESFRRVNVVEKMLP